MKRNSSSWRLRLLLSFSILVAGALTLQAQDEAPSKVKVNFGADFVSRYIWRGADYGNSPAIQPNLSVEVSGFKVGAWGSYGFTDYEQKINDSTVVNMGHYAECDLFVAYTVKWFTIGVTDYFFPNGLSPNNGNNYFNYKKGVTGHTFEGNLSFNGTEKLPLTFSANMLFYGNDPGKDSTGAYTDTDKNNFSTYFEAAYTFNISKINVSLKPFIGGIPFGSAWYGDKAGIVNLGLTASKAIKITEHYSIPVYTSIITNPQKESIFLVFGLTL